MKIRFNALMITSFSHLRMIILLNFLAAYVHLDLIISLLNIFKAFK